MWGISYVNLNMKLATIPSYDDEDEKTPAKKGKAAQEDKEFDPLKAFIKSA